MTDIAYVSDCCKFQYVYRAIKTDQAFAGKTLLNLAGADKPSKPVVILTAAQPTWCSSEEILSL